MTASVQRHPNQRSFTRSNVTQLRCGTGATTSKHFCSHMISGYSPMSEAGGSEHTLIRSATRFCGIHHFHGTLIFYGNK